MKDRVVVGFILGAIIAGVVYYEVQILPAFVIFFLIVYEITERHPPNKWGVSALLHAFGILFVIIMSRTEIFFIATVVILNDTFAYFGGKYLNFGVLKKQIFPETSPNKTWGGFIYGLAAAILGAIAFNYFWHVPNISNIITTGAVIALCAVFGDWLNSKFKRSHDIKDSCDGMKTEGILKGHGGFYDRFDAITMAIWGWNILKFLI